MEIGMCAFAVLFSFGLFFVCIDVYYIIKTLHAHGLYSKCGFIHFYLLTL